MVVDCFLIMSPAESVVARYSCKDTGGDYKNGSFGIGICSFVYLIQMLKSVRGME